MGNRYAHSAVNQVRFRAGRIELRMEEIIVNDSRVIPAVCAAFRFEDQPLILCLESAGWRFMAGSADYARKRFDMFPFAFTVLFENVDL